MPTYDYECRKCGHTFEAFQSMTEDPLTTCPKCKGKVRRLIGGGLGIIFKGSGFYVTDNKSSSSLTSSSTKETDAPASPSPSTAKEGKEGSGGTPSSDSAKTPKEKVKS